MDSLHGIEHQNNVPTIALPPLPSPDLGRLLRSLWRECKLMTGRERLACTRLYYLLIDCGYSGIENQRRQHEAA